LTEDKAAAAAGWCTDIAHLMSWMGVEQGRMRHGHGIDLVASCDCVPAAMESS
jgi:hypothetical protein